MAQSNGKTVLVTGGAGYIGSHCVVTLQEAGYEVIALDNFANSVDDGHDGSLALKRVEKITGKPVTFYKCDLLDTVLLKKIFENVSIKCSRLSIVSCDFCFSFKCLFFTLQIIVRFVSLLEMTGGFIISTKLIRSFILRQ